jgi:tetratricopeptide (TPR) repeat protein
VTDTQQFLQLAIRQINIGNPGAAILPLHRVLASDPQHPLAHAHLAHSLRETGQAAEARREIAMALALSPENAYTRRIAGVIAIDAGEFHEAEDHLNAARRLNLRDPWVYRWLARLYRRTGRSHLAVPILEEGLQQVPDEAGLMGAIASLLLAGGETRQAACAAAATLQFNPESADAHSVLGVVRLLGGDTARASEHALLALRNDPGHVRANRLQRLIGLKRNPLFALCWLITVWVHRATQRSSATIARYAFIAIVAIAGAVARDWGGNALAASLLALLIGLALAMKLLERSLLRTVTQVRLSTDF